MYAQLVDRIDAGRLARGLNYRDLWLHVHRALDDAHAEGRMKAEIGADPAAYVVPDPDVALSLLDQKAAGKQLLLITNSEWPFTRAIMSAVPRPVAAAGHHVASLFDLVIVGARKPEFFAGRGQLFRVVDERGLLEPCVGGPTGPGVYLGGHADAGRGVPRGVRRGDPLRGGSPLHRRAGQQGHPALAHRVDRAGTRGGTRRSTSAAARPGAPRPVDGGEGPRRARAGAVAAAPAAHRAGLRRRRRPSRAIPSNRSSRACARASRSSTTRPGRWP